MLASFASSHLHVPLFERASRSDFQRRRSCFHISVHDVRQLSDSASYFFQHRSRISGIAQDDLALHIDQARSKARFRLVCLGDDPACVANDPKLRASRFGPLGGVRNRSVNDANDISNVAILVLYSVEVRLAALATWAAFRNKDKHGWLCGEVLQGNRFARRVLGRKVWGSHASHSLGVLNFAGLGGVPGFLAVSIERVFVILSDSKGGNRYDE